jgi:cobalt-zinc-cadmium efflux system outer membrane protein
MGYKKGAKYIPHNHLMVCRMYFIYLVLFFILYSNFVNARHLPISQSSKLITNEEQSTIKQFILHVWKANPIIQSAESEVDKADANFSQAKRPIYNPSLNIDAQRVNNVELLDTYTAGLSQTIDLYHKKEARSNVGQYTYLKAKENLSDKKLKLGTKTLKTLAEYRLMIKVVSLAKERTKLLYRFKEQNKRKFQSGDIAQVALDLASLAYAEAISQQATEEMLLSEAEQNLIVLALTPIAKWPQLPNYLPRPLEISLQNQEKLVQKLPIIHVFNNQVSIAKARIGVRMTETRGDPTISVRGGTEDDEFLIGAGINIPLFVRNDYHDNVYAANHNAIAFEQIRFNTYRESKAALQGSLWRYKKLFYATGDWNKASKDSLNNGVILLNRLWSAGEISTTDYIVQLKQRLDSQIAGAKLKLRTWKMWFELMETSGRLNVWLSKA